MTILTSTFIKKIYKMNPCSSLSRFVPWPLLAKLIHFCLHFQQAIVINETALQHGFVINFQLWDGFPTPISINISVASSMVWVLLDCIHPLFGQASIQEGNILFYVQHDMQKFNMSVVYWTSSSTLILVFIMYTFCTTNCSVGSGICGWLRSLYTALCISNHKLAPLRATSSLRNWHSHLSAEVVKDVHHKSRQLLLTTKNNDRIIMLN